MDIEKKKFNIVVIIKLVIVFACLIGLFNYRSFLNKNDDNNQVSVDGTALKDLKTDDEIRESFFDKKIYLSQMKHIATKYTKYKDNQKHPINKE